MEEAVKYAAFTDQQNEASVQSEVLPEGTSGTDSKFFETMDENVAAAYITDQQNKEDAEDEVITEEASGAPEDLDVGTIAHPEENKYQDAESSAHPEVPEDSPEENEVPVAGSRDEGNTHKTPEYGWTMDLYVSNIDKNDKHTCRTIY